MRTNILIGLFLTFSSLALSQSMVIDHTCAKQAPISASTIKTSCDLTYEQTLGNSWHFVGQSQYVNTYRGLYWVGKTKNICSVDMNLNYTGDISAINYNVTVWEVDIDNNLELTTLLATSEPVSGSLVQSGGSWISFDFAKPFLLTTGKTVILVSRVDKDNYSVTNMLRISNNYDMNDEQNDQFNVHYTGTTLAGRHPGDEDQPEPFAFDIKLYGEDTTVNASIEYPAAPLNPIATAVSSLQINLSWNDFNVAVTAHHYNIYMYNTSTAALTYLSQSSTKNYNAIGLSPETEYHFVITTVSANGNESYHTDIASATTEASTTDTEVPTVPQNLTATAASGTQIDLNWDASTDNIAVAGYKIYRDATLIDTAYTNSYNNIGLTASTQYTYTVLAYDASANESEQSIQVNATTKSTGISVEFIKQFNVYPNPTNGIIKLEFGGNTVKKVAIFDLSGKILITKNNVQKNGTLDISKFENGVYFINIITEQGNYISKIIKK